MPCRFAPFALGAWLVVLVPFPPAARADALVPLDLGTALTLARQNNRLLTATRLRIDEARGDLIGAGVPLRENPELDVTAGPRLPGRDGRGTTAAVDVGILQRFELGGQRGHRTDAARERLAASEAGVRDAGRVVSVAVATLFYEAMAAAEKERIASEGERLATELLDVARVRLDRGAGTELDRNAATIALAQARRVLVAARSEVVVAQGRLAEVLGLPPSTRFDLRGGWPAVEVPWSEDETADRAVRARPDLAAADHETRAARASADLAASQAWPDLGVGAGYGLDEGDHVVAARLTIPLPFFQRNQGERARARAEAARRAIEADAARLSVETEARREHAWLRRAVEALRLFDADLLRAQQESAALLLQTYEAGKVPWSAVVLFQRDLLETRLAYVDALLDAAVASVRVRAAAGLDLADRPDAGGDR